MQFQEQKDISDKVQLEYIPIHSNGLVVKLSNSYRISVPGRKALTTRRGLGCVGKNSVFTESCKGCKSSRRFPDYQPWLLRVLMFRRSVVSVGSSCVFLCEICIGTKNENELLIYYYKYKSRKSQKYDECLRSEDGWNTDFQLKRFSFVSEWSVGLVYICESWDGSWTIRSFSTVFSSGVESCCPTRESGRLRSKTGYADDGGGEYMGRVVDSEALEPSILCPLNRRKLIRTGKKN
jgi:hypothetical protein